MKNISLLYTILFTCLLLGQVQAQSKTYPELHDIYYSTQANGSYEMLKVGTREILYTSSVRPNHELKLIIVSSDNKTISGEYLVGQNTVVQFPNVAKNYVLQKNALTEQIDCYNPDNTQQIFSPAAQTMGRAGIFVSEAQNGLKEYLAIYRDPKGGQRIEYWTSQNSRKNDLDLRLNTLQFAETEGSFLDIDYVEFTFFEVPNQIYKLQYNPPMVSAFDTYTSPPPTFICTNPDGSTQLFTWLNKEINW